MYVYLMKGIFYPYVSFVWRQSELHFLCGSFGCRTFYFGEAAFMKQRHFFFRSLPLFPFRRKLSRLLNTAPLFSNCRFYGTNDNRIVDFASEELSVFLRSKLGYSPRSSIHIQYSNDHRLFMVCYFSPEKHFDAFQSIARTIATLDRTVYPNADLCMRNTQPPDTVFQLGVSDVTLRTLSDRFFLLISKMEVVLSQCP